MDRIFAVDADAAFDDVILAGRGKPVPLRGRVEADRIDTILPRFEAERIARGRAEKLAGFGPIPGPAIDVAVVGLLGDLAWTSLMAWFFLSIRRRRGPESGSRPGDPAR